MSRKALALKYRPKDFSDVCEQKEIIGIFQYMLDNKIFPNSVLLCGPAGCGKTTTARIIANKINDGLGTPIEIDAASNNGVDNVREIIQQSKARALDCEYKVFIIDECHSITNQGFQAFLKCLEEPNSKSIFIFCTTDPQKLPATILSRVQRFDFTKITFNTIVNRLKYILDNEIASGEPFKYDERAIRYIAKIADGGMRDAITLMDKCLGNNGDLSLENVINSIGAQDYSRLFKFTEYLLDFNSRDSIEFIEKIYFSGVDIKQFISQYIQFLMDICKFKLIGNFDYIQIPEIYEKQLLDYSDSDYLDIKYILNKMVQLKGYVKWEQNPKLYLEAEILNICKEDAE